MSDDCGQLVAGLLLATVTAASGCYDLKVEEPDDGGADSGSDGDSDSDADSDGDSDVCDEDLGDFVQDEDDDWASSYFAEDLWTNAYSGKPGVDWEYDWIGFLDLRYGEVGSFTLDGQGDYQTCDRCLFFGGDCPALEISDCTILYMATSGSLDVLQLDSEQPVGSTLEFDAADLFLEEVLVNWNNEASEIVEGGETLCVGSWHFESMVNDGK